MIDLYKNIRKRRIELDLTQADLAKALGYADKSMIAKIEKGVIDLPLSKIELFASALGVTPSELMGSTWENDILDIARSDVVDHFCGDAFRVAKFQEAEHNDSEVDDVKDCVQNTTAAHKEGENFTQEELQKIEEYKKLLLAARPKD